MGNFKIKCIEPFGDWFTEGKVYDVVNGVLTDEYGATYYRDSFESIIEGLRSKFELVVENNFTIKCVSTISDMFFTEGENYKVIDGRLTGNRGNSWGEYGSVEEINKKFSSQFELVLDKTIDLSDKKEENMRFKKEDLQLFDVAEFQNGWKMLVIVHDGKFFFSGIDHNAHTSLEYYDFSLKNMWNTDRDLWVVKVYRPKYQYSLTKLITDKDLSEYKLLWEEKQELELTLDEIAEKFGVKVENLKIKK